MKEHANISNSAKFQNDRLKACEMGDISKTWK